MVGREHRDAEADVLACEPRVLVGPHELVEAWRGDQLAADVRGLVAEHLFLVGDDLGGRQVDADHLEVDVVALRGEAPGDDGVRLEDLHAVVELVAGRDVGVQGQADHGLQVFELDDLFALEHGGGGAEGVVAREHCETVRGLEKGL